MVYNKSSVLVLTVQSGRRLNLGHGSNRKLSIAYPSQRQQHTLAATGASPGGEDWTAKYSWPEARHPHKVPSPYQILKINRGEKYTKAYFTELVKLYHPDLSSHAVDHDRVLKIPAHIRLERYRLIISAHTILSDPAKRLAYDSFGAGWGHHENVQPVDRYGNHVSTYGPDSPMRNATWEDWERWRQRRDRTDPPPQTPVFLSNTAFVSLIIALAALGGIGQATRADSSTKSLLQVRAESHQKATDELQKARTDAMNWTKEERIVEFLRIRDPSAYEDEMLRKLLMDPDTCSAPTSAREGDADFVRTYKDTNFGVRHTPEGSHRTSAGNLDGTQ